MSSQAQAVQAGGVKQMVPRCQYCGADPAPVIPAFMQFGGGRVAVFLCANMECRAIHSAQLIQVDQPNVGMDRDPLIVTPRM